MPNKRREVLAKYFLDLSKVALAIGVVTPFLTSGKIQLPEISLSLLVGIVLGIMGYSLQPKE